MRFVRTLAALAAVAVLSMNSVEAGAIVGTQEFFFGFRVTNSTNTALVPPASSDLHTAQYFRLNGMTSFVGGGDFGDVNGDAISGMDFGNLFLNTTIGTGFSFSSSAYGNFQSTQIQKVSDNLYYVFGSFAPGLDFDGLGLTSNTAEFDVALDDYIAGHALSGSATLITPAVNNTTVPEPSSLALACVGGLIGLVAVCRNRK
ncbi:MAG: PEP-CTERM sorting domain-containing protein [Schlesneria sp.]